MAPLKRRLRRPPQPMDGERDERKDYESDGTAMILRAIETAANAGKAVADRVAKDLEEHTAQDDDRFTKLTQLVESVATDTKSLAADVKSLLESRSFVKGAWWTIVKVATAAAMGSGAIFTLLNYLRGH